MRIVCLVACAALAASSGSALAASCNKGMLWPFVRTAGDCLTDAEIAAGQTGVYSGPTTTNVDVSTIKPDPALQNGAVSSSSSSSGGFFEGYFSGGLLGDSGLFGGGTPQAARPGEVACNKGAFWPFSRDPGDCLTEQEKKEGHTGVYRADEVVKPAPTTAAAAQQAAGTPAALPVATSAPAPVTTCSKGWLWPFVKSAGDCVTDIEKKSGRTDPVITPASATAAGAPQPAGTAAVAATPTPSAAVATPTAAAAAPTCSKGWLWPFVKSAGDCVTDVEKKEGRTDPVATPVSATPAGAPQPVGTAVVAATPAPPAPAAAPTCSKGWLWPFVKSAGDCVTDVEKKEGRTDPVVTPVNATMGGPPQPVGTAASNATPAPSATASAPPAAAACSKGWLWPFVKSAGDCPTDAEKK